MLSWKQAKAKVNPDPAWNPRPGSDEWKQVSAVWGEANARLAWDKTAVAHPHLNPIREKVEHTVPALPGLKYARNTVVVGGPPKKLSKEEWMEIPENKARFDEAVKMILSKKNRS